MTRLWSAAARPLLTRIRDCSSGLRGLRPFFVSKRFLNLVFLSPRFLRAKDLILADLPSRPTRLLTEFSSLATRNSPLATTSCRLITGRCSLIVCAFAAIFFSGCGYHVAGRTSELPKSIHVIAVPAMENKTTTFKIEQKLTAAAIHEFLAKTTYKIVSDPNGGDAVLTAKVVSLEVLPLLFQSTTTTTKTTPGQTPQPNAQTPSPQIAQATAMTVTMRCEVTFTERDTDKVLYHTDNFVFRNQYQLASTGIDPTTGLPITPTKAQVESFFQEGDPALDRMARDFASRLVSAVLENF
jgi:lipopolysaccharide assembly LptE-like protein